MRDANNFERSKFLVTPDSSGRRRFDALADSVLVRKVVFGKRLVNNRNTRMLLIILSRKLSTRGESDANRFEIVWPNRNEVRGRPVFSRNRATLDLKRIKPIRLQRMIVGNRRVLHTRQSRKTFEQLLVKVIYLSWLRILGMGQRESGREHSFSLESRIYSLQQP